MCRAMVAIMEPEEAAEQLDSLCKKALASLKQPSTPPAKISAGKARISYINP